MAADEVTLWHEKGPLVIVYPVNVDERRPYRLRSVGELASRALTSKDYQQQTNLGNH